jgi:hypothetical protein
MIEYNDIKDLIIWNDPIIGEISLDFIISALKECVKNQSEFEDIIYNILKNNSYDDKTLASLFNLSKVNTINTYLKMITDEL